MPPLSLKSLVERYRTPNVQAIAITGSHARDDGSASEYSDIDLLIFTHQPEEPGYTLEIINGTLISLSRSTITDKREELAHPRTAIWAVPGLRQARSLHDPDGAFGELQQIALDFQWEPMQAQVDAYASELLMGYAEEAHKILTGLARHDEATIMYPAWGMVVGMGQALAIQRGLIIPTENTFFDAVQTSAGRDSLWTRYYRLAAGFDILPQPSPAIVRGVASLFLFAETVALLRPILRPTDIPVIDRALELISTTNYQLPEAE